MTDDQIALNEIEIVEFSMNLEMNKRQAIEVGEVNNCTTTPPPGFVCLFFFISTVLAKELARTNINVVVLFAI